ncbi:VanZ family protein [Actinopolyspora erythraea]|uniref:VanZ family protein n=1 Tax=Actinopolyspora erythraea TaxID=414996 RepID=UPI00178C8FCC|nr:VanZ family protein [Actinopolyspora erythraea]
MLDPFSPRAHRALFVLSCVASQVILFTPAEGVPDSPPGTDKLVHLALFAVLALTGGLARITDAVLLPCLVCYAPLSETLQQVLPLRRDADPLDMLADLCGTAIGYVLVVRLRRRAPRKDHRNSHLRVRKHRSSAQSPAPERETGSGD